MCIQVKQVQQEKRSEMRYRMFYSWALNKDRVYPEDISRFDARGFYATDLFNTPIAKLFETET